MSDSRRGDPRDTVVDDAADAKAAATSSFPRPSVLPSPAELVTGSGEAAQRFRAIQPLGTGGIGEVVLVEDRDIDRRVAVKRLRPEQRSAPGLLRFVEEVRIIGQLEHPNIVPVHDVGVDDHGQHYFIMKYVEGDTMEAIIDRLRAGDAVVTRRFTPEYRIEVFIGVLNAVHYAHSRGVLHRDIKPSNIMIGPYGEVTLMDWGIAKRAGAAAPPTPAPSTTSDPARTQPGDIVGTPMYMAPEQAAGDIDALDERSDIYSLGLTFLEWMTLGHPLERLQTVDEILAAQRRGAIEPRKVKLAFEAAGAPCEYGVAIARALEHDPARRYRTVAQMIELFREMQSGDIPVSCHITLTKRATRKLVRFADRNPGLYTLLFFGCALATVAGVVALVVHLVR